MSGLTLTRDTEKTREQLISELQEMRERVAALERLDAELKQKEEALLKSNRTCYELTEELDDRYRIIKVHDAELKKNLQELNEKNLRLHDYALQLKRKRITIQILGAVVALTLLLLGLALTVNKAIPLADRVNHQFKDNSYRPMDLERKGEPHPTKAGGDPAKSRKAGSP